MDWAIVARVARMPATIIVHTISMTSIFWAAFSLHSARPRKCSVSSSASTRPSPTYSEVSVLMGCGNVCRECSNFYDYRFADANGHSNGSTSGSSGSRRNGGSSGSSRHHHHHHQHKVASPFGAPMLNYSMMDFFMPTSGFTSFSSMTHGNGSSGVTHISSGPGASVKRTSTSTVFVNGKKLMTKRYDKLYLAIIESFHICICIFRVVENGKETVFSYENDVLKSKTVMGSLQ